MAKKPASGLLSILLLIGLLALACNIGPTKGNSAIYIRADGSIEPLSANITSLDNVTYYFTENNYDELVAERDNIVIDGAGYTLQGFGAGGYSAGGNGTYLVGRMNVTVKNLRVRGFVAGIMLDGSSNCTLRNNVLADCGSGIWLASSGNNTIIENMLNACDILFWPVASDNQIIRNNITGECHGIRIFSSERNHIYNNTMTNCSYGMQLLWCAKNFVSKNTFSSCGLQVHEPSENIVENNTVNGKPLVYLEDLAEQTVDDAGQVIIVNCSKIRVETLNISDTAYPVQLWRSNNTEFFNNNIVWNKWHGVELWYSSNTTFEHNKIAGNLRGVSSRFSSNHILRENDISDNYFSLFVDGSVLSHFNHDIDLSNTVNGKPIYYWVNKTEMSVPSEAGYVALVNCSQMIVQNLTFTRNAQAVLLAFTSNSTVTCNNFNENEYDIYLCSSQKNNITRNTMAADFYGVYLRTSSNNTIKENLIMGLNYYGIQAIDASHNCIINNTIAAWYGIWLESSSSNLIHYNDFIGTTPHHFFTANSINIWDNGYPSGGNYWSDYSGADIYSGPYQNETGADGIGDSPYIIDLDNRDRYPRTSTRFPWDITGPIMWVPDGKCDIRDVAIVAQRFGSQDGDGRYDARADITGPAYLVRDGKIDIRDVALVALHFGEEYL